MEKPVPHFSNLVPDIILCSPCKSLWVDTAPSLFLHWPFSQEEIPNKSYWVPVGAGYALAPWLQQDRQDPRLPESLKIQRNRTEARRQRTTCVDVRAQTWPARRHPWTVARQAPLSTGSPGRKAGAGRHALLQGNLPDPGIKLTSPA